MREIEIMAADHRPGKRAKRRVHVRQLILIGATPCRGGTIYLAKAAECRALAAALIEAADKLEGVNPETPTWEELRGVAPDATNGLSSEAFVRANRDEWERE